MAETPCGSAHESPVRGQRTRPTLKADMGALPASHRSIDTLLWVDILYQYTHRADGEIPRAGRVPE
jgi:hypothetical protein